MGCIYICDGCGKQTPAVATHGGEFAKPPVWFQRSDEDGIQVACSRQCIETVAAKTGKTPVVLPI